MSKHTSPPPGLADTLQYIEGAFPSPLSARLVLHQGDKPGVLMVGTELIYSHRDGRYSIVRRAGERVSASNLPAVLGALFRAAFRLHQEYSGQTADDIIKLHLWNNDLMP